MIYFKQKGGGSSLGHNHDETYSPLSHTHSEKADKVVVDEYDEYDAPEGYVAIFDAYGNLAIGNFKLTELAPKVIDFVDCSSSLSLSAAQCSGTILTNYSQGAEDVQINLPTVFKGLSLVCVIGTAQAGNTWKLTAPAGSKFYLDGVAGSTGESIIVTPAVGNLITVFAFQTGADTFDLIAQTGQGTWTAGA